MNKRNAVDNPFPGLRPFREDEEYLFFGRENQVDAMVDRLAATRFLAVVGTSGSGKSSLVNCGLRPALHGGLMARAGTVWRMAQFRPGSNPMRAMARALAAEGVLFKDYPAGALTLAEIVDTTLRMSKLGLIDMYEQANLGEDVNLLVVVDQFEELFRYRQFGAGHQENPYGISEEATAFVNLLLEAKVQTTHPIYVVLTMRSDFLGDCTQFPGLAEAINAGQYLVPRLTRDERRAAISGPVGVGGAEISPVLLTRLVNDVGDNPDQLSILQHALNRTWYEWERSDRKGPLDLPHYEAIGTMERALDRHAERAYTELTAPRKQQICEKIFKALTDKATDPRGVRRPTRFDTLCALADATPAEVTEVIDVFRKPSRSFLMPPAGETLEAETVIDISHESLMRVWEQLKTWASEEAQSAHVYTRLAETAVLHSERKAALWNDPDLQVALDWQEKTQPNKDWAQRYDPGFEMAIAFLRASQKKRADDEAERVRLQSAEIERTRRESSRLRRLLAAMAVFLLFALASTATAVVFYRNAEKAKAAAEIAAAEALDQKKSADDQKLIAEKASKKAEYEKKNAEKAEFDAFTAAADALTQKKSADEQRLIAEKKTAEAESAKSDAESERDKARSLRDENKKQATTYGYFKEALDALAVGDRETAASRLQQALEYFEGKGDTKNVLSTYINIGDVYRDAYQDPTSEEDDSGPKAIENYDKAIQLIRQGHGDKKMLTSTLEKAGSVFAKVGDTEDKQRAASYYSEAAVEYSKLGDKDNQVARLIEVGGIYITLDDEESAREAFERAVEVYRAPFDANKVAETNQAIAEQYQRILDGDEAEDENTETTETTVVTVDASPTTTRTPALGSGNEQDSLAQALRDRNYENRLRRTSAGYFSAAAAVYETLSAFQKAAEMFVRAGQVLRDSQAAELKGEAAEHFRHAAKTYERVNDKENQVEALISGGDVFRKAGDERLWPKANEYYDDALKVYRDVGDKGNDAGTLARIARSYRNSDKPEQKRKAIGYYKQAAAIYKENQDKVKEVNELLAAAEVLDSLGGQEDQKQAAALYELAVAADDGDYTRQVATLIRIGRLFVRTNDPAKVAKRDKYFQDAVALAREKGGSKAEARASLDVGIAYYSGQRRREAVDYFEKSRSLYQADNDLLGQGIALYRLATAKRGQEALALADQSLALLAQVLPDMAASADRKALAEGYWAMGRLFQGIKKDNEKALPNYKIALDIYVKIPDYQKDTSVRSRVTLLRGYIRNLEKPIDH